MNSQIRGMASAAKGDHPVSLGGRGPTSIMSDSQAAEVQKALDDAIARGDVRLAGDRPLGSVSFSSAARARGFENLSPVEKELFTGLEEHGVSGITHVGTEHPLSMMLDDEAGGMAPQSVIDRFPNNASMTAAGNATHEIGHVWAAQHGLHSDYGAAPAITALEKAGLGPAAIQEGAESSYGASDPREALAELYSNAHTPGFKILNSDTASKFQALENTYRTHDSTPLPTDYPVESVEHFAIHPGHPRWSEILAAAEKNIEAGKWIATIPSELL